LPSRGEAPLSAEQATRLAHSHYQQASLTGDPDELGLAERAIDAGLRAVGPWPDLCLLKAMIDLELHRLPQVRRDLALAPGLAETTRGRLLEAAVLRQEGRVDEARKLYETVRTWDALAGRAALEAEAGELELADELYAEAEDELTAKELRSYAWVELQRGDLDLRRGSFDEARAHYERAERAYSGHWLTEQHLARLLVAEGRLEEAAEAYERLVARVRKPELRQALGDVLLRLGEPERARRWHDEALAAYLASAERGEVHYYHHLAELYETRGDTAAAAEWARRDYELRPNASTRRMLDRIS
jgi:tetratricopeptide (TPR) repeat protein